MHIILLLIIIGLLVAYFFRQSEASKDDEIPSSYTDNPLFANTTFAWLSKGNLYLHDRSNATEQIQSPHIQKLIDRSEKQQNLHGWKQGTSWGTTPTGKVKQFGNDSVDLKFTSAHFLPDNKLLYFLEGDGFGGLFRYGLDNKEELRISHRQGLSYKDLNHEPVRKQILCSSFFENGVSNITVMDENCDDLKELTGGDTVDSSPDWLADDTSQIVYQSQGIARGKDGYAVALGPSSIQLLDMNKKDVSAVMENEAFDYLSPKVAPNGDLYFIRRPFEIPSYKTSNALLDGLFFPFRLLRAVFHYLNFFSLMYSNKPLISADSPYVEADLKDIVLQGKKIDTEKTLRKAKKVMGVASLVPPDWILVKKDQYGNETILAQSVAAYQFTDNGHVIYSNGLGVFGLDNEGKKCLILKDKLISDLIV